MHIESLGVNEFISRKIGLRSNLNDLGSLVLLVGSNGCGKTRLLQTVDWLIRQADREGLEEIEARRARREAVRRNWIDADLTGFDGDHMTLAGARSDYNVLRTLCEPTDNLHLVFDTGEDRRKSLREYRHIADALAAPAAHSVGYAARLSVGLARGGLPIDSVLAATPLAYIQDVCERYRDTDRENVVGLEENDVAIEKVFTLLAELVERLSGLKLLVSSESITLGLRTLADASVSEGQLLLLRMAVLLHSWTGQDFTAPILLDEPELHLHPEALIRVVDEIRARLPRAQLWIATHSLSLTAHIAATDPRSIWFGASGRFTRAGRTPERVVVGLLGGLPAGRQVGAFCSWADEFAASAFAAECLVPPETVGYKSGDPQLEQIMKFVGQARATPIQVLDIGAGQGRLFESLVELVGMDIAKTISYYAVEPNEKLAETCREMLRRYYPDGQNRVFDRTAAAASTGIDMAVMANVLHEIPVQDWECELTAAGNVLNDGGFLLVVEDTRLSRGELAHDQGFLILEAGALCALFGVSPLSDLVEIAETVKYGPRLQATAIAKELIKELSKDRIRSALETQQRECLLHIRNLRRARNGEVVRPDYDRGRLHGFHAQLHTNLTLALEELE